MSVASQPEDVIEVEVGDVAHGGVFVARHEGRVVFVSDAITGERVRARLTDTSKSSFWRADAIEVLDASSHRRAHVWGAADISVDPHDRPGGAEFGHIEQAHQRSLKTRVLQQALERFGGIRSDVVVESVADESVDGTGWRTRLSLHVDDDGRVGPYAARSHRVIEVEEHPLATPAIARAAQKLVGSGPGRIDLVQPADGRVRVITRPDARTTPSERAREVVVEHVGEREFRVDAGGFWQVHRSAAATLASFAREAIDALAPAGPDPDALHFDLYGGVGLFASVLAEAGGPATRVVSVESDAAATEHAGENLAEWVGARAETARVDRWLAAWNRTASARERARLEQGLVVLDPPRAGAGKAVVAALGALQPAGIVYVACDPVALSRDLALFARQGYAPVGMRAVDLFPNSHHLETVVSLAR